MHELGIVFKVIEIVGEAAKEYEDCEIESVTLEIGEVSGVVEEYLQNCWSWAIKKYPVFLDQATLHVEKIPAITYCEGCGKLYETVRYGKICPFCKSSSTWLLQGNEFLVKDIAVRERDDVPDPFSEPKS